MTPTDPWLSASLRICVCVCLRVCWSNAFWLEVALRCVCPVPSRVWAKDPAEAPPGQESSWDIKRIWRFAPQWCTTPFHSQQSAQILLLSFHHFILSFFELVHVLSVPARHSVHLTLSASLCCRCHLMFLLLLAKSRKSNAQKLQIKSKIKNIARPEVIIVCCCSARALTWSFCAPLPPQREIKAIIHAFYFLVTYKSPSHLNLVLNHHANLLLDC